jgi:hypothetical protein
MDAPPVSAGSGWSFEVIIQLIVSSEATYSFQLTPFFLQWQKTLQSPLQEIAACHLGPRRSPRDNRIGVLPKDHTSNQQNHSLHPSVRGSRMKLKLMRMLHEWPPFAPVRRKPCTMRRSLEAVRRKPCTVRRSPEAVRRKPCAGSRAPEAVRRKPCAGSRAPGAVRRKPCAGSRAPEAARREPCNGSRAPEAVSGPA